MPKPNKRGLDMVTTIRDPDEVRRFKAYPTVHGEALAAEFMGRLKAA